MRMICAKRWLPPLLVLLVLVSPAVACGVELQPETIEAWNQYVHLVEQRIARELSDGGPFLVGSRLPPTEQMAIVRALLTGVFAGHIPGPLLRPPALEVPFGLIHHWLGQVFVPGIGLDQVLEFVQQYDRHSQFFSEVIASKLIARDGDRFYVALRLQRKKIVTITYDTTHTVLYRRHDAGHASSRSVATRIAELENVGEKDEREKPVGNDSGYLWRLNSYWRFEERDGGVVVECESLGLSRSLPFGIGLLIRPIVENISRESMERMLEEINTGVKSTPQPGVKRGIF
jgi:hypothetical protein